MMSSKTILLLLTLNTAAFAQENDDRYRPHVSNADISDKPTTIDTANTAAAKCKEMSRRALATNTNVLVIGFEGLISTDHFGARKVYRYEKDLADKKPDAEKPLPSLVDGWVLHGLMVPLIEKTNGGVKTLNFPHYRQGEQDTAPALCAKIWLSDPKAKNRKLVILGHSMGGFAAGALAQELEKQKLSVDLLVTMDPVDLWKRPKNIKRWENYQGVLPVFPSGIGADYHRYIFHPLYSNHFTMTRDPQIFDSVSRQVIQMMDKKPAPQREPTKFPAARYDYDRGPGCNQCEDAGSAL